MFFREESDRCRLTGGHLGDESSDDYRVKTGMEEPPQPGVRGLDVEMSAPVTLHPRQRGCRGCGGAKCLLVCNGSRRQYRQSHLISRGGA